jgi:outer membrane receptor protein involved in Fe transport
VNRKLTLNLGVRWEMDTPLKDLNNRLKGLNPAQINPVSGTPGVVTLLGQNGVSAQPYSTDWNNFGPRFGFAWQPLDDKTVVRGGYGIFYAHPFDLAEVTNAASGFN